MRQRDDIVIKYDEIYGTIAGVVANVVRQSPLTPHETYARLKLGVPAAWVTRIWLNGLGARPDVGGEAAYAKAYLAEPARWSELGVSKSGTRTEYINATDEFFAATFLPRLKGCDLVLDLGCGWGHRMFDLYVRGLDLRFFGGERSPHAQAIINSVSRLFPAARIAWFPFDFLAPDFASLPGDARSVGVITCHAVEQVAVLGTELFDSLIARFPEADIRGVHIEPVAWQIDPARTAEAAYARDHSYNTDLFGVLKGHPALRLTEVSAIIHDGHDQNPSSLLAWERVR